MHVLAAAAVIVITLTAGCTVKKNPGQDDFTPPSRGQIDRAVKNAPRPAQLPEGLSLELIDYIDCASAGDCHPFRHDGRSRPDTAAGLKIRRTGAAANSFFTYRFAVAQPYAPHLVVLGYPDDRRRMMSFSVTEAGMKPRYNGTFHIETGVITGGRFAVTGGEAFHSFFLWPSAEWPTLVCANQQPGTPAALSGIWVYRIRKRLPLPEIAETDTLLPRRIGIYVEDSRAVSFDFGYNDPQNWEHLFEYLDYCGLNLLSFDAMLYRWPKCNTVHLPGKTDDVARALELGDRHGIDFVAVFDPTAEAEIGGMQTGGLENPEVRRQWVEAVTGFVKKYGTHSSLAGVSFGGPAGCARFNNAQQETLQLALYERLQAVAPDMEQYVFFGYRQLHNHYFMEPGHTPYDIISSWERGKKDFSTYLGWSLQRYWRDRGLNHWKYLYKKNLIPVRMSYPVDEECYSVYPGKRTGRPALFRDLLHTPEEKDLLKHATLPVGGCTWGTYFEQALYLDPAQNHAWHPRKFIAPQLMPDGPEYMRAVIAPLVQGDATTLFLGGWHPLTTGHETDIRRFAKAFRSLPARAFKTVSEPGAPVITRVLRRHGRCYFYFLNTTDRPVEVSVRLRQLNDISWWISHNIFNIKWNVLTLRVEPYELATFCANRGMSIRSVRARLPETDKNGIRQRISAFKEILDRAETAGLKLPAKYRSLYKRVRKLAGRKKFTEAGALLGHTVPAEAEQRLRSRLDRPVMPCPRVSRGPKTDGTLKDWPDIPGVRLEREADLATHLQMPNHWTGPADFSAGVRAVRSREHLHLGITVTDNIILPGDELILHFSGSGYRSYADTAGYDTLMTIPLSGSERNPAAGYAVSVTDSGTVCEVRIPWSLLSSSGTPDTLGLVLAFGDMDRPGFLNPHYKFTRDNVMVWPRAAGNTDWWRDPRQCGLVIIKDNE